MQEVPVERADPRLALRAVTVATLSTFMPVEQGDQVAGARAPGRRG